MAAGSLSAPAEGNHAARVCTHRDLALLRDAWLAYRKALHDLLTLRDEVKAALPQKNEGLAADRQPDLDLAGIKASNARMAVVDMIKELAIKYAKINASAGEENACTRLEGSVEPLRQDYLDSLEKIPEEFRSRPMSFVDAAGYLGITAESRGAGEKVRARLKYPLAKKSQQRAVFDLRDFPVEKRAEMRS